MPIQTINIGYLANDGTGDDLREAFIKVNENFTELEAIVNNTVTVEGENVGTGIGLFKGKLVSNLQFKTLIDGFGIDITESGNEITVTGDPGVEEILVLSDNGSIVLGKGKQLLPIQNGKNINTRVDVPPTGASKLIFDVVGDGLVNLDKAPKLGGNLHGNNKELMDLYKVTSHSFHGELFGNVHGIDVRDLESSLLGFDFGTTDNNMPSLTAFLATFSDVDMGTYTAPTGAVIDGGLIRNY
jgi:hypothetical protein